MSHIKLLLSLVTLCATITSSSSSSLLPNSNNNKTTSTTTISTTSGHLIGSQVINGNSSVYKFLSVPYAEAPIGELRFQRPKKLSSSHQNQTINATQFGPTCVQYRHITNFVSPLLNVDESHQISEDCLKLHIFVPSHLINNKDNDGKSTSVPVIVWLPGEGFDFADARQFDATHLAARTNSIVVTVQYRVGIFGFLYAPNLLVGATGNQGLFDQVAALEWIHDNIEAFGGNRDSVTLMGRFSGAMSISSLITAPKLTRPPSLFNKAVLMSGIGVDQWTIDRHPNDRLAQVIANLASDDSTTTTLPDDCSTISANESSLAACLIKLPAENLLQISGYEWRPIIDNELVVDDPTRALAGQHKLAYGLEAIMLGSNHNEGLLCLYRHVLGNSGQQQQSTTTLNGSSIIETSTMSDVDSTATNNDDSMAPTTTIATNDQSSTYGSLIQNDQLSHDNLIDMIRDDANIYFKLQLNESGPIDKMFSALLTAHKSSSTSPVIKDSAYGLEFDLEKEKEILENDNQFDQNNDQSTGGNEGLMIGYENHHHHIKNKSKQQKQKSSVRDFYLKACTSYMIRSHTDNFKRNLLKKNLANRHIVSHKPVRVYQYELKYKPTFSSAPKFIQSASHGDDVLLMFGLAFNPDSNASQQDIEMSKHMMSYLKSFIHNQTPNSSILSAPSSSDNELNNESNHHYHLTNQNQQWRANSPNIFVFDHHGLQSSSSIKGQSSNLKQLLTLKSLAKLFQEQQQRQKLLDRSNDFSSNLKSFDSINLNDESSHDQSINDLTATINGQQSEQQLIIRKQLQLLAQLYSLIQSQNQNNQGQQQLPPSPVKIFIIETGNNNNNLTSQTTTTDGITTTVSIPTQPQSQSSNQPQQSNVDCIVHRDSIIQLFVILMLFVGLISLTLAMCSMYLNNTHKIMSSNSIQQSSTSGSQRSFNSSCPLDPQNDSSMANSPTPTSIQLPLQQQQQRQNQDQQQQHRHHHHQLDNNIRTQTMRMMSPRLSLDHSYKTPTIIDHH